MRKNNRAAHAARTNLWHKSSLPNDSKKFPNLRFLILIFHSQYLLQRRFYQFICNMFCQQLQMWERSNNHKIVATSQMCIFKWRFHYCCCHCHLSSLPTNSPLLFIFQGTAMFLHWLVGMVYVFYFASFVLLLREVLRPGVLWFLRNLNDPDFQPVQEVRNLYLSSKRFCKIPQWNSIGLCNIFFSQVSTVSSNIKYVYPYFATFFYVKNF